MYHVIQYNWEGGIAIPTTTRISKDMILDTAFSIAREEGIDNVSNRLIAKRLNSSIRPIYYQFKNSKELKFELKRKIEEYFYSYITEDIDKYFPMYKQIGIRYIMFAKEECNLFKALFMSESDFFAEDFVTHDENYEDTIYRKKEDSYSSKEIDDKLMEIASGGLKPETIDEYKTFMNGLEIVADGYVEPQP